MSIGAIVTNANIFPTRPIILINRARVSEKPLRPAQIRSKPNDYLTRDLDFGAIDETAVYFSFPFGAAEEASLVAY